MKNYRYTLLFAFFCLSTTVFGQFLDVVPGSQSPYSNPTDLIRDQLAGSGIEVLNVQFEGDKRAIGYFTGGLQSIGLQRGLIMTTGRAATESTALGATETGGEFANTDMSQDISNPLLDNITTGPQRDAVSFRITFRASSDSIRFRYVFASEEYPEFGCSNFNDIFGFFLEGPGIPAPMNIALVPGTNLPVAINNIHPANPTLPNCFPYNSQYYHDNTNSNNQPVYDGYLDVFTAEAKVEPCQVYVMTLALADISDAFYDSAVFLEANSFSGNVDIAASFDPGEAILPENAQGDTVHLNFHQIPQTLLPLKVTLEGSAVNGVDYLPVDTLSLVTTTDTSLAFMIQPVFDTLTEPTESVILTVRDTTGCFYRAFTIYLFNQDTSYTPLDSLIYNGGTTVLKAPLPDIFHQTLWSGSSDAEVAINSMAPMAFSDIAVQVQGDVNTIIDTNMIESVCFDIEHAWDSDLNIYLFAPNGKFVELSTRNGANGDNYTNTCFSPGADQPITFGMPFAPASAAPFTGTFQPEGKWSDLLGAPLNGTWRLGVVDPVAGFAGKITHWSLAFTGAGLGKFKYEWSTGETTPNIEVSDPGEYTVTVSNEISSINKSFVLFTPCNVYDSIEATIHTGESYQFGAQTLTQAGTYTQTFAASNGCDSVVVLNLTLLSGTQEPGAALTVNFSPNPSTGETMLALENSEVLSRVRVFDLNGKLVYDKNLHRASSAVLQTTGWKPGWYVVELENPEGYRAIGRLMVK